jgi:hypothetical protein
MLRRFILTGATCLTLSLGFLAGTANATDYGYGHKHYTPHHNYHQTCRYETVTEWVTREVPYTVCETRYDECGRAYHVNVTRYRTVRVQVTRQVPVCNYNY